MRTIILSCWIALAGQLALAQDKPATVPVTLKSYVTAPDAHYKWEKVDGGQRDGVRWSRLHMVSQEWKQVQWKHVMWVVVPQTDNFTEHALLYISGGGWKPEWGDAAPQELKPNAELQRFAGLAVATNSPLVVIQHVPFQPMFGGMVEDEIISKTFVEFIKTGDGTWPLLLPMVKAAVRAMDTTDAFIQKEYGQKVTKFTLFGASKRGWTTWLSSATDPRVDALAPAVIDVLNMKAQMKFQKETWGEYSEQIQDYSSKGIPEQMETTHGQKLLALVDPYEYREQIQQPKLLIFGTNDRYWPVDACKLYWNALQGDKYLLYVPNQGHGINDMERVLGSIAALQRSRTGGQPLPKLEWSFQPANDKVNLKLTVDQKTKAVRGWIARSQTKDFRDARWSESPMQGADGTYSFETARDGGYLAVFGEVVIDNKPLDAFFSTNLQVFEPASGN